MFAHCSKIASLLSRFKIFWLLLKYLFVLLILLALLHYAVFKVQWWAQVDSNYRPHAYQACALTI